MNSYVSRAYGNWPSISTMNHLRSFEWAAVFFFLYLWYMWNTVASVNYSNIKRELLYVVYLTTHS